jgi:hypothetical protein
METKVIYIFNLEESDNSDLCKMSKAKRLEY